MSLEIENTDICYVCGAPKIHLGVSMHCWDIEYECGCQIFGPIDSNAITLGTECPKLIREDKLKRILKK